MTTRIDTYHSIQDRGSLHKRAAPGRKVVRRVLVVRKLNVPVVRLSPLALELSPCSTQVPRQVRSEVVVRMRLISENNVLCAKVPFSYVLVVKVLEFGCLLLLLTINPVPQMI